MPPRPPQASEPLFTHGGEGTEEDGPGVRTPFIGPEAQTAEEDDGDGGEGASLGYEGVGLEGDDRGADDAGRDG